jgi:hypothetical protein
VAAAIVAVGMAEPPLAAEAPTLVMVVAVAVAEPAAVAQGVAEPLAVAKALLP